VELLVFQLEWSSKDRGIESAKCVLSKKAPHIISYKRFPAFF